MHVQYFFFKNCVPFVTFFLGLIAGLEQENLALKDQNAVLHEQITHLEKAVQHVNKEKEQHETTIKELNVQIQQLRGTCMYWFIFFLHKLKECLPTETVSVQGQKNVQYYAN